MNTLNSRFFVFLTPLRSLKTVTATAEYAQESRYLTSMASDTFGTAGARSPEFPSDLLIGPRSDASDDVSARTREPKSGQSDGRDLLLGGMRKRCVDLTVAVGVLILTAPLLLVIAATIWRTMGSPIIYRHRRIGCHGREFECLKFRTMVTNADDVLQALLRSDPAAAAEWQQTQKLAADPRVTWLGHALRRSSLDELPQIFNVLRGEMSCVGPRPIVRNELARYGEHGDLFQRVRPGMTGLWQVSGRSSLCYDERVTLDCQYVTDWSVWYDVKILLRTVPTVLNVRQAC